MDVVLGVSMTSGAVRMALVEGADADGVTVDQQCFKLTPATPAEQVIAGILGTRDSAAEGGHRIHATGVAWNDHAAAAQLTGALRAHNIDDVVLVSELHAASALAQAIGQGIGCDRTALMFLERDRATLAVVRADDGAVVRVESRTLHDPVLELQAMVAGLERLAQPPQAVFIVGSGIDVAALKLKIAAGTTLTVHAPEDGALALARGAALAAAKAPRFEASTVGLASTEDAATVAGIITQRAFAGYMAPLGYSAVLDEESPAGFDDADEPCEEAAETSEPFLLVGSALMTIFVVGVLALVASIVVTIRPTGDQRPSPAADSGVSSTQPNSTALETIPNPVPVVQEAPRTVFVTPRVAAPAAPAVPFVPQDPAPIPQAPAPVPEAPTPAQPAPVPAVTPAAPVTAAPVIPQILPQLLPQLLPQFVPQIPAPPVRAIPIPKSPAVSPSTTSTGPPETTPVQTSTTLSTPTPSSTTAPASTSVESTSATTGSTTTSPSGSSAVSTTPLLPTPPLLPTTPAA